MHSLDPGGLEIFTSTLDSFRDALTYENRTLKRALTDPRIISGIGNAYSDEILHAARLSPITHTHKLKPEEWERLYSATRATLQTWVDRLRHEAETEFPEKVTAFRKDMAVHGRYGQPCPRLRRKNSANSLRGQRNELLRGLPDRWKSSGGPRPVAPVGIGLAAHSRRTRSAQTPLNEWSLVSVFSNGASAYSAGCRPRFSFGRSWHSSRPAISTPCATLPSRHPRAPLSG